MPCVADSKAVERPIAQLRQRDEVVDRGIVCTIKTADNGDRTVAFYDKHTYANCGEVTYDADATVAVVEPDLYQTYDLGGVSLTMCGSVLLSAAKGNRRANVLGQNPEDGTSNYLRQPRAISLIEGGYACGPVSSLDEALSWVAAAE